jgi:hypothetical protein
MNPDRIFCGVGKCHVKGDIRFRAQAAGIDFFPHLVNTFFEKVDVIFNSL